MAWNDQGAQFWRELGAVKRIAVTVGAVLSVVGLVMSTGLWQWLPTTQWQLVQHRQEHAVEKGQISQQLEALHKDVKEGQLLNRRATLLSEKSVLEGSKAKGNGLSAYERDRLRIIDTDLVDIDRALDRLRAGP